MDARKPEVVEKKDLISILPNDIKRSLCHHYLNGNDSFNLFRAARRAFLPAYPIIARHEDHPLKKLLSHAALGEWDAAQAMWSKDPLLLTCRGTIYHPNRTYEEGHAPIDIPADKNPGRYKYIDRTVWQIAWMNEEYEMVEKMAKHIGEDEKKKQFAEIFPNGKLIKYHWDLEEANSRLNAVFEAVIKDPSIDFNNLNIMSESTRSALSALYDYVKPAAGHQTGLVFDPNIYVDAVRLYGDKEKNKKFQTWDQHSFWLIRVEEYLASLLGTGYLRPHAQGIRNHLKGTSCILADHSSYFAFRRSSNSLPGFRFFVNGDGEQIINGDLLGVFDEKGDCHGFQKLCRAKMRAGAELIRTLFGSKHRLSKMLK